MYQNEKTQVENTMNNRKIKQSMFYMHIIGQCAQNTCKKIVKQVMVGDTC